MSVDTKNWQELKKPNSLDFRTGTGAKRKATFVAEPLERGFGLTRSNPVRRAPVQLQGAVIASIRIEDELRGLSGFTRSR